MITEDGIRKEAMLERNGRKNPALGYGKKLNKITQNKELKMDIGTIIENVIGPLIAVYLAFIFLSSMAQTSPELTYTFSAIFGALVFGVITYFRSGEFTRV